MTFFSGTDTSELQDNTDKYPYYLSLIVNHKGQYCAKVAYIAKTTGYSLKSLFGEYKQPDVEYLCTVDCDIVFEVDESFKKRIDLLKSNRAKNSFEYYSGYGQIANNYSKKSTSLSDVYSEQLSLFKGSNKSKLKSNKGSGVDLSKYYNKEKLNSFVAKWITNDTTFDGTLREAVLEVFKTLGNDHDLLGEWFDLVIDNLNEFLLDELALIPSKKERAVLYSDIIDALDGFDYYDFIGFLLDELKKFNKPETLKL